MRASMNLDGQIQCCTNHCFYNGKGVEARVEAGLDEPRWSLDGICDVAKLTVEQGAEARIEAGLDEPRWSLDGI